MTARQGLCLIVCAPSVLATELYSWHVLETTVIRERKFELTLHHRTRTRHEFSYLDQVRFGAIARFRAARHFVPYVGSYYQPQQVRQDEWFQGRRVFIGFEAPAQLSPRVAFTGRLAAERHMGTGRPDYNRYRSYARFLFGRSRVTPFVQNEMLAVRQGYHSMRNSGGLRFTLNKNMTLEAGYLYDVRRANWGGHRQAIVTTVRWQPAE